MQRWVWVLVNPSLLLPMEDQLPCRALPGFQKKKQGILYGSHIFKQGKGCCLFFKEEAQRSAFKLNIYKYIFCKANQIAKIKKKLIVYKGLKQKIAFFL